MTHWKPKGGQESTIYTLYIIHYTLHTLFIIHTYMDQLRTRTVSWVLHIERCGLKVLGSVNQKKRCLWRNCCIYTSCTQIDCNRQETICISRTLIRDRGATRKNVYWLRAKPTHCINTSHENGALTFFLKYCSSRTCSLSANVPPAAL